MNFSTRTFCFVILGTSVMLCAPLTGAHPSTEQFIPVGYWSSVGRPDTYVGALTAVSTAARQLTYVENGRDVSLLVGPTTRIYVDRSHLGERSRLGSLADCVPGRMMEVKLSATDSSVAEWVKVKAER